MAALETLELIKPSDQFIFDTAGNLTGAKNSRSRGADLRVPLFAGADTYANIKAAFPVASYTGFRARATDAGPIGMMLYCDGANWLPDGPQTLSRGAIPVGLAPTGTMADNGAVTLGTAIPSAYASCYMHFPLNAISAGSAAGLYYVVMSSTTVGQVFNNTYTSGIPTAPAIPTAFVTTGPGAFTASTARQTLISLTLPGGLMGLWGSLDAESAWTATNNANVKSPFFSFGGNDLNPTALTSTLTVHDNRLVMNRGSAALQVALAAAASAGGWGAAASLPSYLAVNTASDVTMTFAATKATATDWMGIEAFRLKISA